MGLGSNSFTFKPQDTQARNCRRIRRLSLVTRDPVEKIYEISFFSMKFRSRVALFGGIE